LTLSYLIQNAINGASFLPRCWVYKPMALALVEQWIRGAVGIRVYHPKKRDSHIVVFISFSMIKKQSGRHGHTLSV
jgi:hypothetical protein